MVKNLPSSAGDTGSIPGRGTKIPHAVEQRSPCVTSRETPPKLEKACCNRSPCSQKKKRKKIETEFPPCFWANFMRDTAWLICRGHNLAFLPGKAHIRLVCFHLVKLYSHKEHAWKILLFVVSWREMFKYGEEKKNQQYIYHIFVEHQLCNRQ